LLLELLIFSAGVGLLVGSAWLLVTGGARIAAILGVHPVVVGLTVVAWGTSAPELFVSLVAGLRGNTELMLGNVIGSNLANLGLILGTAALVFPVTVDRGLGRREIPLLLIATFLFSALCWDLELGRADGLVLVLFFGLFMALTIRSTRRGGERADSRSPAALVAVSQRRGILVNSVLVLIGIGGLTAGGHLIVTSAVAMATRLGASEALIGLSLVAVGTSLPEFATTLIAALRRENDIALGNIIGSNLFNLLAVAGPVALIHPLSGQPDLRSHQLPGMLILTLVLPLVVARSSRVGRVSATVLLVLYAAIMTWWLTAGV
jgi:cation:H+ antiporter